MSPEQQQYTAYHSPEQKAARSAAARRFTDEAITEAHRLFFVSENADAARETLFSAGMQEEGICFYMDSWASEQ